MAIDIESPGGNETALETALRALAVPPRGALVGLASDLTTQNYSTAASLPFTTEIYDTDSIHDNVTNNTRLTMPASGYTWCIVGFTIFCTNVTSGSQCLGTIRRLNSSDVVQSLVGLPLIESAGNGYTELGLTGVSAPTQFSASDYFDLRFSCSDTSVSILSSRTCFWVRLLG
jgi:hypothetical protein